MQRTTRSLVNTVGMIEDGSLFGRWNRSVGKGDFVQISSLGAGEMYMGGSMCPPISFGFFFTCV